MGDYLQGTLRKKLFIDPIVEPFNTTALGNCIDNLYQYFQ